MCSVLLKGYCHIFTKIGIGKLPMQLAYTKEKVAVQTVDQELVVKDLGGEGRGGEGVSL